MVNKSKHKLGIIVPYRNRPEHLRLFQEAIVNYLNNKEIDYEIIIVSQDNGNLFNRGVLLNIGFNYSQKLKCDYVVFHDVDMLPIDVDYSYSEYPLHLATNFKKINGIKERVSFDEYFGGVTLFPSEIFKNINGYSNKYWGWGYEDDDLLLRCKKNSIELDTLNIENMGITGKYLKFNGVDAYVKGKNNFNLNNNSTIFISFYPSEIICNHTKDNDTYTIFSIPGYDFSISYNSFARYNFCAFDNEKNVLYVNSNIKRNYLTNITISNDFYNKKISVYQDGILIGIVENYKKLYPYSKESNFFIGVGNPDRLDNPNYFTGYFKSLAIFNDVLTEDEIYEISNNYNSSLKNDFGNYFSSKALKLYYDSKFIDNYELTDLSGNKNNGKIIKCEIERLEVPKYRVVQMPKRRNSLFGSLSHEENGFFENKWKTEFTRWNQLRFYNEVSKNDELSYNDGLSDLNFFTIHGKVKNNKITHIDIGI